eukprot:14752857-Alexandrium_andersonii.AAC.1
MCGTSQMRNYMHALTGQSNSKPALRGLASNSAGHGQPACVRLSRASSFDVESSKGGRAN